MNPSFPRFRLTEDYTISRVLKGGWQLAGGHGPVNEPQAIEDMREFVEAGVTTFDCADIYTGVEALIGRFLKAYGGAMASGELPSVQIHTKCVPDLALLSRLTKGYTETLIDRSLRRLGVERLDLVQFYWWDFSIPGFLDLAGHLVDLQKAGKIRYLGVTNINGEQLRMLLDAGIPILSNQVQYSLLDRRPREDLLDLCQRNDIHLLCYGSVAGGFLTDRYLGAGEPMEPLENRSLTKYKLIIDEFGGWDLFQELLSSLRSIADRYGVGIGEVAVQYILQQPGVAGAIVGARNNRHLDGIRNLSNFALADEDLSRIEAILDRSQGPRGPVYGLESQKDGKHGRIMRYNLNQESMDPPDPSVLS